MKDPHDPRDFRNFVTLNADGSVRAVHQFDATIDDPLPGAIDVTALGPQDFTKIAIDPKFLTAHADAKFALAESLSACAVARGTVLTTTQKITGALADAVQVQTATVEKEQEPPVK